MRDSRARTQGCVAGVIESCSSCKRKIRLEGVTTSMGAQGLRTRAIRLTATALVCAGLAIPGLSARGDAAASAPQVTVTTEVSPRVLNSIDQRSLTLNVGIVNNGPAVQVDVTIGGHRWPAAALTDGGPLGFGSPTLEPPATFKPVPVPPHPVAACLRERRGGRWTAVRRGSTGTEHHGAACASPRPRPLLAGHELHA